MLSLVKTINPTPFVWFDIHKTETGDYWLTRRYPRKIQKTTKERIEKEFNIKL